MVVNRAPNTVLVINRRLLVVNRAPNTVLLYRAYLALSEWEFVKTQLLPQVFGL